jgi:hypothetical protein
VFSVSIGSFHAIHKGKLAVCSTGNDGPTPMIVTNVAPWEKAPLIEKSIHMLLLGTTRHIQGKN